MQAKGNIHSASVDNATDNSVPVLGAERDNLALNSKMQKEANFLYVYAIWALHIFFCFCEISLNKRGERVQGFTFVSSLCLVLSRRERPSQGRKNPLASLQPASRISMSPSGSSTAASGTSRIHLVRGKWS